ncbi:hypothetical protein EDEG_03852 [Edhazardia aedis USNM 41457]|uniref:AB hydrolase-1 domain-containing protein n=1 Tax=Edhazardia aedis (strain USNM 41457) TaxID=1003232 RepID=J9D207_EDHAE|nr:hypothetical protein EDEG_03852 [Edhazardia aedis USNM 41457]|eukprot:EJW01609.1 hypothetical protein EDEG_03852 [Edhazardia aedis USNM 41457]
MKEGIDTRKNTNSNEQRGSLFNIFKKIKYERFILFVPYFILLSFHFHFLQQHRMIYQSNKFDIDELKLCKRIHYNKTKNKEKDNYFDIYSIEMNSPNDLIYFHGSRIRKDIHIKIANKLAKTTKCNIIVPFYRGYGSSNGSINEVTIMSDVKLLNKVMKNRKNTEILYGQSLGCAAALYYASLSGNYNFLILENPFNTMKEVSYDTYSLSPFFGWVLTEKWPNDKRLKEYKGKVLFLISQKDNFVKAYHHKSLSNLCDKIEIKYLEGATHFNATLNEEYYKNIEDFINDCK